MNHSGPPGPAGLPCPCPGPLGPGLGLATETSSSDQILCRAASSAALSHTGDLEWEVESTTVTHSSADWWDLLRPLA